MCLANLLLNLPSGRGSAHLWRLLLREKALPWHSGQKITGTAGQVGLANWLTLIVMENVLLQSFSFRFNR